MIPTVISATGGNLESDFCLMAFTEVIGGGVPQSSGRVHLSTFRFPSRLKF